MVLNLLNDWKHSTLALGIRKWLRKDGRSFLMGKKKNKTKPTRIKKMHLLKREGVYVHITAVSDL